MDELKPCPFCGGKVALAHTNHRSLTDREHMFKCSRCGALTFLQSNHCICGTVDETVAEATTLFNRRPTPENKPHAEWIADDYGYNRCSECGYEQDSPECVTPYCPHCGAHMEEPT